MLKYCKILNEEIGSVQIGAGCPDEYYKEIGMELREVQQSDKDYDWYLEDKCPMKTEEEKKQEEKERILSLSMTRSDFFDGTIKAFGADEGDLLPSIQLVLSTMEIEETEKKIALNNFKNALNFYRKHPLFNILSNIPLKIGDITVKITAKQWDKFFDETSKRNKDAWKEIIPNEIIKANNEEEAPVINTEEVGE